MVESEKNMRPEGITELLRARPFVPLRFHMTDGQSYDVRHPRMEMVLRSRLVFGIDARSFKWRVR